MYTVKFQLYSTRNSLSIRIYLALSNEYYLFLRQHVVRSPPGGEVEQFMNLDAELIAASPLIDLDSHFVTGGLSTIIATNPGFCYYDGKPFKRRSSVQNGNLNDGRLSNQN